MITEATEVHDQADLAQLLDEVLANSHPLMVEGFFLAALPYWYNKALFAAMRQRADNRDEGIIERLSRYSFIATLEDFRQTGASYTVHPAQRAILNERWIAQNPEAYREAHRRALAYWKAHPDPDPDAHTRNLLYHRLFVDTPEASEYLIGLFRAYNADRQFTASESMLATAHEARRYLLLGGPLPAGFDDLLAHLGTRLGQMRGHWAESLEPLERLRKKSDLPPRLLPYVIRAHGDALANTGNYVAAIQDLGEALALFDRQAKAGIDPENIQAERAYTLIALGDAHAGLARAALGREVRDQAEASRGGLRELIRFLLALPLTAYLSRRLGLQVWHPRFWGVVADLDWIIARLFATGAAYYRQADPILAAYGRLSERVLADEKLAALYLELGDASRAEALYVRLLDEETTLLSEYRRATARLGLGRALLAQRRPAEALPHLVAASPLLRRYEDASGEALAELTVANTLREMGQPDVAPPHYEAALRIYEKQDDRVGATQVGEWLDTLAHDEGLSPEGREAASRSTEAITSRHYPVRYRHPATLYFQRAMVMLLALVIFLIPILAIRLEIGTTFEPDITFRAAPLLDDRANFNPELSQAVQMLKPAPVPKLNMLWQASALLLLLYLALSALLGLLVVVRTPLSTVQAATYGDLVRLDGESIRTGEGGARREVPWPKTQVLVRANVYPASNLSRDDSQAAVAAQDARVIINGQTAWYESLLARIERHVSPGARRVDVSFSALRSPMGALYLVTLAALILLSIVGVTNKDLLFGDLAGTSYNLADLYPYFYLGLFLPPMWWFVVQPLRQRRHIDPENTRPWLVIGGIGLAIAALRVLTRFRPWLTVPDIYPTLAVIILVSSAAITMLRQPHATGDRLAVWARSLGAVAAVLLLALMGAHLWREVVSYNYLIRGNDLRDKALSAVLVAPDTELLERATDAYERALAIADAPLLGMEGRAALRGGPGLPPISKVIWFAAANSRGAMHSESGKDRATILAEFDALLQETQHPEAYVGRALAALRAGTLSPAEALNAPLKLDRANYLAAVLDLTRAIEQERETARYLLWRGFARHTLGFTDLAEQDYKDALVISGEGTLSKADRATALTGLGWVEFGRGMQQPDGPERRKLADKASEWFQQAVKGDPKSADAWLGRGYALYTLRKYDEALLSWGETDGLRPNDPAVKLSLGALYWRTAGLVEGYTDENGKDKGAKEYCREEHTLEQRTKAETRLQQVVAYWTRAVELSGLDDKAKARTYTSLGQIYYLMQWCPGLDEAEMLQKSVEADDRARELDPANAAWPYRSGLLANNLFIVLRNGSAGPDLAAAGWAQRAMQDFDRSIALSTDAAGRNARQNAKRDRVQNARNYARAGLLAGRGALEAGDVDRATRWFDVSLALAERTGISPLELYRELSNLEVWLAAHPEAEADSLRRVRELAIQGARTQNPAVATFLDGLSALSTERIGDAAEDYRRAVEEALAQGDLASIAAAATALRYEPGHDAGPLLDLLRDNLPRVEVAARSQRLVGSVDAAVRTAVLAAALEDTPAAGRWLNEVTRRTTKDTGQYYPAFYPARDHLKALWAATGITSDILLAEMDGQLDELFAQAPELEQNGSFWGYRAWLKYHLGVSAFRLGDETAARALLDSGIKDAARAHDISANHQYVYTYLPESAWGWYHVERGDDAYARGDLTAALEDYEAAFDLIEPMENGDAKSEKTTAAFRAGHTALRLAQPERAVRWYQRAVTLVEQNNLQVALEREITKLRTFLNTNADATLAAAGEEILAQAQAAYDRLEQK